MKINLDPFEVKLEWTDIMGAGTLIILKNLQKDINDLTKRIEALESLYPVLQKGVARDPKPDEMKLQQGRKSPTREWRPLAADHPASSHKKYWTKKNDQLLRKNFKEGMLQRDLMPMELKRFSTTEIRDHCIEIGLMDQYGIWKNGAGSDS